MILNLISFTAFYETNRAKNMNFMPRLTDYKVEEAITAVRFRLEAAFPRPKMVVAHATVNIVMDIFHS